MKRIVTICAILEEPELCQKEFNEVVSNYQEIIRGRMGIPFNDNNIAAISIVAVGTMDEINSFTGKLGNIAHVQIKTAISKKEVE